MLLYFLYLLYLIAQHQRMIDLEEQICDQNQFDKCKVPPKSNFTAKEKEMLQKYRCQRFNHQRHQQIYEQSIKQVIGPEIENSLSLVKVFALMILLQFNLYALLVASLIYQNQNQQDRIRSKYVCSVIATVSTSIYTCVIVIYRRTNNRPIADTIANVVILAAVMYLCFGKEAQLLLGCLLMTEFYPYLLIILQPQTFMQNKCSFSRVVYYAIMFGYWSSFVLVLKNEEQFKEYLDMSLYSIFIILTYCMVYLIYLQTCKKQSKSKLSINGFQTNTIIFYPIAFSVVFLQFEKMSLLVFMPFLSFNFIISFRHFIKNIFPQIRNTIFNEETFEMAIKNNYLNKNKYVRVQVSNCQVSIQGSNITKYSTHLIECCLCLSEESCYYFSKCQHVAIGHNCLLRWLQQGSRICPYCRIESEKIIEIRRIGKSVFTYGIYQLENGYRMKDQDL